MRISIINLISILILISCGKSEDNLIGVFESEKVRFYELPSFYISGFDKYAIGAKLTLNSDNSFDYTTCANIMSGTWQEINDSIFLFANQNKYKIDSLNIVGFNGKFATIPSKPIKFKIEGDLLVSQSVNRKGMKSMSKLRKNKP
jgi:hypothetical protein